MSSLFAIIAEIFVGGMSSVTTSDGLTESGTVPRLRKHSRLRLRIVVVV